MFAWWGRVVVRARWWVLAAAGALVLLGGAWGTGVFGTLSGGGFDDPNSPSSIAYSKITSELGRQGADVLVLYTSPNATVDQPELQQPVTRVLGSLQGRPEITSVASF